MRARQEQDTINARQTEFFIRASLCADKYPASQSKLSVRRHDNDADGHQLSAPELWVSMQLACYINPAGCITLKLPLPQTHMPCCNAFD